MKHARTTRPAAVLAALALAITGCGGDEDAATTTTIAQTTVPVAEREPTTLTLWSSFGDQPTIDAFKPIIEKCQADNPWLTIDYVAKDEMANAVAAAAEAGDVPDVIQADFSGGLAKLESTGIAQPLDELAERDGFEWSQFTPGGEALVSFNDQHWGIPFSLDTAALFYNGDVLDEVGAEPPTTFDELREVSAKLTERDSQGRLTRIGWVPDVGDGSFVVPSGMLFGGSIFSEDGTEVTLTDTDAWARSIRTQKEFFDALGPFEDVARFAGSFGSYDSSENFFIKGQVPLYLEASYFVTWPGRFGEGKPANWGVVPMPTPDGAKHGAAIIGSGNAFYVPAKATDVEASWIAASCMATAAQEIAVFQEFNGNIPANAEALEIFERDMVPKIPQFQTFVDIARAENPIAPSNGVIVETARDELTELALKYRRGEIPDAELEAEIEELDARLQEELDIELGT